MVLPSVGARADQHQEQGGAQGDGEKQQRGGRRSIAHVLEIHQLLAGIHGHGHGVGAVGGQYVDQVEHAKGIQAAKDHRHHQGGADQRQSDPIEHAQRMDAVHPRGLIAVPGQHLQGGQEEQGHEGGGFPYVGNDHGAQDQIRIRGPGQGFGDGAQAQQEVVEQSELIVVYPAPHLGGNDGGDSPGYEHRRPHQGASGKRGVQHQGDDEAKNGLQGNGYQGEDQGIADRLPPQGVGQHPGPCPLHERQVVCTAHQAAVAQIEQHRIGETEPDGACQGPGGYRQQGQQHRSEKPPGIGPAASLHSFNACPGAVCGSDPHRAAPGQVVPAGCPKARGAPHSRSGC